MAKATTCTTEADLARFRAAEGKLWTRCAKRETGCWEWQGPLVQGYGWLSVPGGPTVRAHRVSLMLKLGRPLKPDEFACHACDNRACVNPDHLFAGTAKDNVLDSIRKGRHTKGSRHGQAKLTEEDAANILASTLSEATLAARYGVDPATIHAVKSGYSWAHLPRPPDTLSCERCGRTFKNRMGLALHRSAFRRLLETRGLESSKCSPNPKPNPRRGPRKKKPKAAP